MTQQVPLVDWNDYRSGGERRKRFIKPFGDALRQFGFVRLKGHGIDEDCLGDMYKRSALLFSLKPDVLMRYYAEGQAGKTGYSAADEKHFWHVCREEAGSNIWPDENKIPFLSGFRKNAEELYSTLDRRFVQLMEALEEYLELPNGTLKAMVQGTNNSTLRLLHYPKPRKDRPAGSIRTGCRPDINILTLQPIEGVDGELIVNAGLMLERVTNGYLPATDHEVVNPHNELIPDDDRYSLPFFGHPRSSAMLEVPERFRGEGFPDPPPPITGAAALAAITLA